MIPPATRGTVRLSSNPVGRSSTRVAPATANTPHQRWYCIADSPHRGLSCMARSTMIIPLTKKAMLPSKDLAKMRVLPQPVPTMAADASLIIRI